MLKRLRKVLFVAVMVLVAGLAGMLMPFPAVLRAILQRTRAVKPPAALIVEQPHVRSIRSLAEATNV